MGARAVTRRVALSIALGLASALALIGLYLGTATWGDSADHAIALLSSDWLFVVLISAAFAAQVGLFTYLRLLQRSMARESLGLVGAGTATSSVSMVACCAHHLADVVPIVGLSGIAAILVDFRAPLMLLGIATNGAGLAVMLRQLWRIKAGYHLVVRRTTAAI